MNTQIANNQEKNKGFLAEVLLSEFLTSTLDNGQAPVNIVGRWKWEKFPRELTHRGLLFITWHRKSGVGILHKEIDS